MSTSSTTVVNFLMCGGAVLIFAVIMAVVSQKNRVSQMGEQAETIASTFEAACPICGDEQSTWGAVGGRYLLNFWPLGQAANATRAIAFRCNTCGHLMLFAQPPEHIKRKREA